MQWPTIAVETRTKFSFALQRDIINQYPLLGAANFELTLPTELENHKYLIFLLFDSLSNNQNIFFVRHALMARFEAAVELYFSKTRVKLLSVDEKEYLLGLLYKLAYLIGSDPVLRYLGTTDAVQEFINQGLNCILKFCFALQSLGAQLHEVLVGFLKFPTILLNLYSHGSFLEMFKPVLFNIIEKFMDLDPYLINVVDFWLFIKLINQIDGELLNIFFDSPLSLKFLNQDLFINDCLENSLEKRNEDHKCVRLNYQSSVYNIVLNILLYRLVEYNISQCIMLNYWFPTVFFFSFDTLFNYLKCQLETNTEDFLETDFCKNIFIQLQFFSSKHDSNAINVMKNVDFFAEMNQKIEKLNQFSNIQMIMFYILLYPYSTDIIEGFNSFFTQKIGNSRENGVFLQLLFDLKHLDEELSKKFFKHFEEKTISYPFNMLYYLLQINDLFFKELNGDDFCIELRSIEDSIFRTKLDSLLEHIDNEGSNSDGVWKLFKMFFQLVKLKDFPINLKQSFTLIYNTIMKRSKQIF
ncbi:hypothetical protein PCE1_001986 [Barthelona sp. PCE]